MPMVGASGAILGMLAACAILFPQFVVFILFFPVPIRIAAIALTFIADTPFGRTRFIKPVAQLANTPGYWARGAVPLGHDEAIWF